MKKKLSFIKIAACFCFVMVCAVLMAQNSDEPNEITTTYYIQNANVIQKPGMMTEGASILIKDGMIQKVGKNIPIPYDAMIIEADSMYAYAGFIDAASHVGIPKQDKNENNRSNRPDNPGNPTNAEAGITPEIMAKDLAKSSEKSVSDMRKHGFTISHILPEGRMLPGRGTIMSLGEGKEDHLIIDPESALYAQWKTARGAYPATIIGMIAKWRDLANNAKNLAMYSKAYKMDPAGNPRPTSDEATRFLVPVMKKELPVFFKTEKILDIHRAVRLSEELGFNIVLAEVKQIAPVMDMVRSKNIPVLLSVDLPKEMKEKDKKRGEEKYEDPEGEEKPVKGETKQEAKAEKEKEKEEDPEMEALKKRKKEAYELYLSQGAEMEKKGIKFGFSFLDGKVKDFKKSVRRMMEKGLSETAVLEAVTTTPAAMMGIDKSYGTLESGKMAHIVITDKPYFAEKSNVKYVFVDGKIHEYEVEKKKKSKGGKPASVAGIWNYEIEIPGMTRGGNFRITQEGEEIAVEMSSDESLEDYLDCTNAILDGNVLTFDATVVNEGMSLDLSFNMEVEGSSMEGSVDIGQFGSFPITGSKASDPE